jgi:hypothetical protein
MQTRTCRQSNVSRLPRQSVPVPDFRYDFHVRSVIVYDRISIEQALKKIQFKRLSFDAAGRIVIGHDDIADHPVCKVRPICCRISRNARTAGILTSFGSVPKD